MAVNVLFTVRLAARQRIALNPRPAQVAMFSLTPCVVVAAVLTFQFFIDWATRRSSATSLPVWMLLYGTGVYTAGLFSVRATRVLGLAFLLTGIVALLGFSRYGVISVALSFGLLHVVVRQLRLGNSSGRRVVRDHERTDQTGRHRRRDPRAGPLVDRFGTCRDGRTQLQ